MWEHARDAPTMDDAPGLVGASEERERKEATRCSHVHEGDAQ